MTTGGRRIAIGVAALAAVAAAAVVVATRGGDRGGPPYDTARDVVNALVENGVPCTGFAPAVADPFTRDQATCNVDGIRVVVRTFADDQAQRSWDGIAGRYGGLHVEGDLWVVSPQSGAAAGDVRDAIGGVIRAVPPTPTSPAPSAPAGSAVGGTAPWLGVRR